MNWRYKIKTFTLKELAHMSGMAQYKLLYEQQG